MAVVLLPLAAQAIALEAGVVAGTLAMTAITTAAAGVGGFLDSMLFGGGGIHQAVEGPKLNGTPIQQSIEGAAIPRVFGRCRLAGQVFWSTRFTETKVTTTTTQKAGKGGGKKSTTTTTEYKYSCSLAVGLCEGPIIKVGRIWADGKPMNLQGVTYRIYYGNNTQTADPKITAVEGADSSPAYRGMAYVVFEELALERFGNRIPNFTFEVYAFARTDQGELEYRLPGFTIIPASGEYAYDPNVITSTLVTGGAGGLGWASTSGQPLPERIENSQSGTDQSNWEMAIDDLEALAPNAGYAQIVCMWFGDDLRIGNCTLRPKVETHDRAAKDPANEWWAGGIARAAANLVTQDAIGPILGGTPSDLSIVRAIQDLKARGYTVAFYPFIYMDIPSGNTLPNPYSNNAATNGQPVFPWRGRITVSPAAGYTGTVDKTGTASTQVNSFFGSAAASDFGSWNGFTIPYTGPNEWSYRRMILHYAKLCAAAGGVDVFFIGTEMVKMMEARSATSTYPAVSKMVTLAADVAGILPSAKLSYAADWSEWNGHYPSDGSNDMHFHLDPLWASADIDYIGIDNYMPLSDWRDNPDHLDATNYDYIYDQAYLQSNIEGGELFTWYYASVADRNSQTRTNITDGAGKPWVFRRKDIRSWWLNQHYNRPGGTESGSPTSWTPQSKPIIFSELGCPSIDKGSNQPNVFYDPKSSESFYPYFSSGARDDYIQRMYIQAWVDYWLNGSNNPTSGVYGDKMIKVAYTGLWTWDARPYPTWPNRTDTWRDTGNYPLGHWLNGKLGQITLPDLVQRLTQGLGITVDVSKLFGLVMGYQLERVMSPRDAIQPLALAYLFDSYESAGQLKFRHRGGKYNWLVTEDQLVPVEAEGMTYSIARKHDIDLPDESIIRFVDETNDYQQGVVQSKRLIGQSQRVAESQIALVTSRDKLQSANDIILMDSWLQRESVTCKLPASLLAADPTDIVKLTLNGVQNEYRIEEVSFAADRPATLVRTDRGLYYRASSPESPKVITTPSPVVSAAIDFVETQLITDAQDPGGPFIALWSNPWKPQLVYRSPTTDNYVFDSKAEIPASAGNIVNAISAGPEDAWDWGTQLTVTMLDTTVILESKDELQILSGQRNVAAIKCANGEWEIIQWVNASLISAQTYLLTQLLRARLGSDKAMNSGAVAGAQFVLLDGLPLSTLGPASRNILLNWKYGPDNRDISDSTYLTVQYAPKVLGLRPYSPASLAASGGGSGADFNLSWIRRCRFPEISDSWEGTDIPLGEESEAYEIDIYDDAGTSVKRTLTSTTSAVAYTSANQVTDFGANPEFVDFEVFQISKQYGRGSGRRLRYNLSCIKSIQNYEVTIAAGANSATQTLGTTVDKNHAYAYYNGFRSNNGLDNSKHKPMVVLTNSTTVTVTTNSVDATNSRIVPIQVVEFHRWAADVQHYTITNSSTNTSQGQALSTPIPYDYSIPIFCGSTTDNASQNVDRCWTRLTLDNTAGVSNNVTAVRADGTGSCTTSVAVVKFSPLLIKNKRAISVSMTSGFTKQQAIQNVNPALSMLFNAGFTSGAFQDYMPGMTIDSDGNGVTVTRGNNGAVTTVMNANAVEFREEWVADIATSPFKYGVGYTPTILAANSQQDTTLSPAIVAGKTLVHYCGHWTNNNFSSVNLGFASVHETSTTNVRAERVSSFTGITATPAFRILQLK